MAFRECLARSGPKRQAKKDLHKRCSPTPNHSPEELGSTRPYGEYSPKPSAPCFSRTCALAAGAVMPHSRDSFTYQRPWTRARRWAPRRRPCQDAQGAGGGARETGLARTIFTEKPTPTFPLDAFSPPRQSPVVKPPRGDQTTTSDVRSQRLRSGRRRVKRRRECRPRRLHSAEK